MRVPKYGCHNLSRLLLSFWSFWTAFTSCCTLSWRSFCFRCVMVDPGFMHCHILAQKILFTSLQQLQTALWILDALLFLVGCEQRDIHFKNDLLNPKDSCKIVNTLFSDIFKVSAISRNFNLRSSKTILWVFVMFPGTTADFGWPERSASSVFKRPCLNSAHQSMIVYFPGAESP